MTTRASAARYARALFDVAISESTPERAGQELSTFLELLRAHPQLHQALTHPTVPAASKRNVVAELLERLKPQSPAGKLLLLLAERDRLALLPEIVEAYQERLNEHQRIIRAEITTAEPLSEEHARTLQQRLAAATGQTVALTTRVDPAIIGGVVTRIGSMVYDGSVASQLRSIRQRLAVQH